jgi:hypothetical protein
VLQHVPWIWGHTSQRAVHSANIKLQSRGGLFCYGNIGTFARQQKNLRRFLHLIGTMTDVCDSICHSGSLFILYDRGGKLVNLIGSNGGEAGQQSNQYAETAKGASTDAEPRDQPIEPCAGSAH